MPARSKPRGRSHATDKDGLIAWSDVHAAAWIGLLETHKRLTRELEAELETQHGLGISALELLSRLARADKRTLRLTTLAEQAGLSLSRVSRIVDSLESAGLVERHRSGEDSRAKDAKLTAKGLKFLRGALETHFDGVERLFFEELSERDVETLARVFRRFRR
jgi:DNA-binding MarR family transcriptional regulator